MRTAIKNSKRESILDTNSDATAMRLFILLVFMLMSCSGVFGQASVTTPVAITTEGKQIIMSAEIAGNINSSSTSQMELALWFMSSKHITNASEISTNSTTMSTKKQFINCGMVPNRILSQTLLKKAMCYETTVV